MEDDISLENLIADIENEASRERVYVFLWQRLSAPRWAQNALGEAVSEEIKQDCLRRLLVPPHRGFVTSARPLVYAQIAFENALKSALAKWRRRNDKRDFVENHFVAEQEERLPTEHALNVRLDAEKALAYLGQLTPRQRVAVLLLHAPQGISEQDWTSVVGATEKPTERQNDDSASKILFPPEQSETTTQRYQRLNSFRRLRTRGYECLRRAIEEDA